MDVVGRREFLKTAAGAAITAGPAVISARGQNDKITIGWIGVGTRGNAGIDWLKKAAGDKVHLKAICDTYDALTSKRPFRDAYGPEIALMLMWTEMRHRFDPELLTVFMKVMAIQPVKILSKRQRSITVGGI